MDRVGCVVSSSTYKQRTPPGLPPCRLGIILNAKWNKYQILATLFLLPELGLNMIAKALLGKPHGWNLRAIKEIKAKSFLLNFFSKKRPARGSRHLNLYSCQAEKYRLTLVDWVILPPRRKNPDPESSGIHIVNVWASVNQDNESNIKADNKNAWDK